ncbi:hypothetical protein O1D80_000626 [Vibrio cholerae]|nr:hypothetical protein [Vibrio cholerae]
MVSFIDTSKLHPGCADRIYKYAQMFNINDVMTGKSTRIKHQILCKLRGPEHKWQLVGGSKGPYEYPTEQDARNDVRKVNLWAKSLKEGKSNG